MKAPFSAFLVAFIALFVVALAGYRGEAHASEITLPPSLDRSNDYPVIDPPGLRQQDLALKIDGDPEQLRRTIAARAAQWYGDTPYILGAILEAGPGKGYRPDCSGFVAYAWGLPQPGPVTSEYTLKGYAVTIPFQSLRLGDAVNNEGIGEDGHMVLFWQWADPSQTRFWAIEMSGRFTDFNDDNTVLLNNDNAVLSLFEIGDCNPDGTGCVIRRVESWNKHKAVDFSDDRYYYAQRWAAIAGYATLAQQLSTGAQVVAPHQQVSAAFVLRNDGAQPLTLGAVTAAGRGPGAQVNGWNAPAADFPAIKDAVLQPGETLVYTGTRQFAQAGDYMIEPVSGAAGEQPIPFASPYYDDAVTSSKTWLTVR